MKADLILDCVGLYCPMPIIKLTDKIKEIKEGEVIELIADDEGVKTDIPAWCKATGQEFLKIEKDSDGYYHVYVKKKK
jgi:TusA-related sulfurtransferase